jgi:hypothetical protein
MQEPTQKSMRKVTVEDLFGPGHQNANANGNEKVTLSEAVRCAKLTDYRKQGEFGPKKFIKP